MRAQTQKTASLIGGCTFVWKRKSGHVPFNTSHTHRFTALSHWTIDSETESHTNTATCLCFCFPLSKALTRIIRARRAKVKSLFTPHILQRKASNRLATTKLPPPPPSSSSWSLGLTLHRVYSKRQHINTSFSPQSKRVCLAGLTSHLAVFSCLISPYRAHFDQRHGVPKLPHHF